jgi:hypothetical protein
MNAACPRLQQIASNSSITTHKDLHHCLSVGSPFILTGGPHATFLSCPAVTTLVVPIKPQVLKMLSMSTLSFATGGPHAAFLSCHLTNPPAPSLNISCSLCP